MNQPPWQPPVLVNVMPTQRPPLSGYAVASLVLGIVGLVLTCLLFGVPSLAAVICGHVAFAQTKDHRRSGQGMAVVGLVTGYVGVLPSVLLSVWFFFEPGRS